MVKSLVAAILLSVASSSFAGSTVSNVTITTIGYDKNIPDAIFIRTSKDPLTQTRVSCHTDTNWNYVLRLSPSTPIDEKMYTALLAAQASKQNITLVGSGLCNASYGVVESLHIMYVSS